MKKSAKRFLAILLTLMLAFGSVSMLTFGVAAETANLTPGPVTSTDGKVTIEKSAAHVSGDTYDITLQVQTTDEVTAGSSNSADVVLVLDASGSMADAATKQRIAYAQDAATSFVNAFLGGENAGDNRIAIVSYATYATDRSGGLKGKANLNDFTKTNGYIASVTVASQDGNRGTNIQSGLAMAKNLLAAAKTAGGASYNKKQVIVLLSDGEPTYCYKATAAVASTEIAKYDANNANANYGFRLTAFDYSSRIGQGYTTNLRGDYGDYRYYLNDWTYRVTDTVSATLSETYLVKAAGVELYSVLLMNAPAANASSSVKQEYALCSHVMSHIATADVANPPTGYVNHYLQVGTSTAALNTLASQFASIAGQTIATLGGGVTDPMGSFITFNSVQSTVAEGETVFASNTLTWDLSKATPSVSADGKTKTYTLTYRVTLDTSASGFVDNKAYATNGTTTLSYSVGGTAATLDFKVPTVTGVAPTYAYTVEYYARTASANGFTEYAQVAAPTGGTTGSTARIHALVTAGIDFTVPTMTGYSFDDGNPGSVTISATAANNVIKLYYTATDAAFAVEYYYKNVGDTAYTQDTTKTPTGGTAAIGTVLGYADVAGYADKFGDTYTFNAAKSTAAVAVDESTSDNIIKLYYDQIGYTYQFAYYKWQATDGVYSYQKVEQSDVVTAAKGTSIDLPDYANKYDGFDFIEMNPETADPFTLAGDTVINFYYKKTTSVIINHLYYDKDWDWAGYAAATPTATVTSTVSGLYEGGRYTATPSEVNGYTYDENQTVVSGLTANSQGDVVLSPLDDSNEINIYYGKDVKQPATVTITRIYTEKVINAAGEEDTVVKTYTDNATGTYYVGMSYTHNPASPNYVVGTEEAALTGFTRTTLDADLKIAKLAAANTITVNYVKNSRVATDVTVNYTYYDLVIKDASGATELVAATGVSTDPATITLRTNGTPLYVGTAFTLPESYTTAGDKNGYTYNAAETGALSINPLAATGNAITIVCVKDARDDATVTIIHNYAETLVVNGEVKTVSRGSFTYADVSSELDLYAGMSYTHSKGTGYTEDAAETALTGYDQATPLPSLTITLVKGVNTITVNYHLNSLKDAAVTVQHVFLDRIIDATGAEVTVSSFTNTGSPADFSDTYPTGTDTLFIGQPFTGSAVALSGAYAGFTITGLSVNGTAQTAAATATIASIGASDTIVFTYERDKRDPATVTVVYEYYDYQIVDGTAQYVKTAATATDSVNFTGMFAGQSFTLADSYKTAGAKNSYTLNTTLTTDPTSFKLTGSDTITLKYSKDVRVVTKVTVVHHYEETVINSTGAVEILKTDFTYAGIAKMGSITPLYAGMNYTHNPDAPDYTKETAESNMAGYTPEENPTLTVKLAVNADDNVITVNYYKDSRDDVTVTVKYVYYDKVVDTTKTDLIGYTLTTAVSTADVTLTKRNDGTTLLYKGTAFDLGDYTADYTAYGDKSGYTYSAALTTDALSFKLDDTNTITIVCVKDTRTAAKVTVKHEYYKQVVDPANLDDASKFVYVLEDTVTDTATFAATDSDGHTIYVGMPLNDTHFSPALVTENDGLTYTQSQSVGGTLTLSATDPYSGATVSADGSTVTLRYVRDAREETTVTVTHNYYVIDPDGIQAADPSFTDTETVITLFVGNTFTVNKVTDAHGMTYTFKDAAFNGTAADLSGALTAVKGANEVTVNYTIQQYRINCTFHYTLRNWKGEELSTGTRSVLPSIYYTANDVCNIRDFTVYNGQTYTYASHEATGLTVTDTSETAGTYVNFDLQLTAGVTTGSADIYYELVLPRTETAATVTHEYWITFTETGKRVKWDSFTETFTDLLIDNDFTATLREIGSYKFQSVTPSMTIKLADEGNDITIIYNWDYTPTPFSSESSSEPSIPTSSRTSSVTSSVPSITVVSSRPSIVSIPDIDIPLEDIPYTGGSLAMYLYAMMTVVSAGGLAALGASSLKSRKHRDDEDRKDQ